MRLDPSIALAWQSYDRLSSYSWVVNPSVPILFFGDLDKSRSSSLRIVTVGLNPSFHEFPREDPFQRFPSLNNSNERDTTVYVEAMSEYFRAHPYAAWFNRSFESMLNGFGASFYDEHGATAIHTDICSPIATNRTWSRLNATEKNNLESDGIQIWHELVGSLRPHLVLISVAKQHLQKIQFTKLIEWETAQSIDETANGTVRKTPYKVECASFSVNDTKSRFIFGRAAQTPFGLLGKEQAWRTGQLMREVVSP